MSSLQNVTRERSSGRERGSALLISLMVMVILTLLGIAYILMAETENQIAVNQKNATQALYVGESAARAVVEWFNNPVGGFSLPATADVDRTLRWVDTDNDGVPDQLYTTAGEPTYKQTSGLLFQKPYRGASEDEFRGDEDHPDIRITAGAFLDTLNDRLLGPGAGTLADPDPDLEFGEITQIDIFAPPNYSIGGNMTRHGMVTIKVTAQKIRNIGGTDRVLAQRSVKVVMNEINYPGADGPLQSCSNLNWNADFVVHWGETAVTTGADFQINNDATLNARMPTGMPYGAGSPDQYFATQALFDAWYAAANGTAVEDPWFRLEVGDLIATIGTAGTACTTPTTSQPCTGVAWNGATSHSNVFQNQGLEAACPDFEYSLFKTVAQRGGSGVNYYSYIPATDPPQFKEGGLGTTVTHKQATDNKSGFFFFDTEDGGPPTYTGITCDNCTPGVSYNSADQYGTGVDTFQYLNMEDFGTTGGGNVGYTRIINAPGEPWFDDGDGVYEAGTETHVELTYAGTPAGTFTIGSGGVRDAQGPDVTLNDTILHGIMYLTGTFDPTGNGKYYGALVAHHVNVGATVDMWYNERISEDAWPPPDSPVPKVYISSWETDNF